MLERGDWLTPRLDYLDYVEKPPLPYWLTALSYRAFGVSEAAAHLPLALWSLLALAGTAWLGSWLFSLETGLAAAAILGFSVQFLALSHLLTPDLPLTASLVWTCALWLRALRRPEDAPWAGTAAGVAMAAAVLCKGLVGALFPIAWVVGLASLDPDLRPGLRSSLTRSGLAPAFLAVGVPWFAAMERRHPGFLAFFFGEQHFQRFFAGAKYQRPGPWYYFFPVEWVGALPSAPLVLAALGGLALGWRTADPREKQLGLWIAGVFAFFSVSTSKLPTYITPIFPQQAILAAALLVRLEREPARRSASRALGGFTALILLAGAAALPAVLGRAPGFAPPGAALRLGQAALALMAAATASAGFGPPLRRLLGAAAGAALCAALALGGARVCEPWLSARPVARWILENWRPGDRILSYGVYLHGVPFYTGEPVDPVNWMGELAYARRDPANRARFGDDDAIRRLPEAGRSAFVVLREREAGYFGTLTKPGTIKGVRIVGPWMAVRFSAERTSPANAVPRGTRLSGAGPSRGR